MSDEAVVMAKAILALNDRAERAEKRVAALEAQAAEHRRSSVSASEERMRLIKRISAVTYLHMEATTVTCGDGCCHEGLGECEYCGEPYPCRTVRAAEGKE